MSPFLYSQLPNMLLGTRQSKSS